MRILKILNPILLFLTVLLALTARHSGALDMAFLGDLLWLSVLFGFALGLGVYAVLRSVAETYRVMTYLCGFLMVFTLVATVPLSSALGLTLFAMVTLLLIFYHKALPFGARFQKSCFAAAVIVLSMLVPHMAALSLYEAKPRFDYSAMLAAISNETPLRVKHEETMGQKLSGYMLDDTGAVN